MKNKLLGLKASQLAALTSFTLVNIAESASKQTAPTSYNSVSLKQLQAQAASGQEKSQYIILKKIKYYVVQKGDTLYDISKKMYGSTKYWKVIYETNKAKYPDPKKIKAGTKLAIPYKVRRLKKPSVIKKKDAAIVTKKRPSAKKRKSSNFIGIEDVDFQAPEIIERKRRRTVTASKDVSESAEIIEPKFVRSIELTKRVILEIGMKIYQNECSGKKENLTVWNDGEAFPSFGIGHFIWYPKGYDGRFTETFPEFVEFARSQGSHLPPLMLPVEGRFDAPWRRKSDFILAEKSKGMDLVRDFLASHITLQTEFIIKRSEKALDKITKNLSREKRLDIQLKYYRIANSENGMYPLIDYVNFKGEGTSLKERYNGHGWGLLQVLEEMKSNTRAGSKAIDEFVRAAKFVLERRVKNSPVKSKESQWLQGWHNRVATYSAK